MAATVTMTVTLPWLVKRGVLALWHELPRSLLAGALALASGIPLAIATLSDAPGWLLAVTTLPAALALTGLAGFTSGVAGADGVRMKTLRLDPMLALVLASASTLAGLGLVSGGAGAVAGAALAAVLLLVAPLALAYGALRGRTGLAALRGGAILAMFRPSWALTLLALNCLGGFAAAASVGFLAIAILPLVATITSSVVSGLVEEIDTLGGRP